jgi:hypothetical protein
MACHIRQPLHGGAQSFSLDAKRRQFLNRRAQRLNLVMRVMLVHFRRCVAGELLPDFL